MRWTLLVGLLIGFTIVFLWKGFMGGDFMWGQWIAWVVGGTIGFFIISFIVTKNTTKNKE
ncbi:hypothetical protein [Sediminibacillus massiliensis]|uniref:hypothetical protein n=1 Tax=Sediminibacillus massiliensis TaxID=1926277 RepID=UPI00098835CA|nr:hypothetical protein [Sediminibacillus massiliensis]